MLFRIDEPGRPRRPTPPLILTDRPLEPYLRRVDLSLFSDWLMHAQSGHHGTNVSGGWGSRKVDLVCVRRRQGMIVVLVSSPLEFNAEQLFVDLRSVLGHPLFLKCEGFNFTGSVKMKAALAMVEAAELSGRLRPGSVLVESSSGNLGVALSMIAASRCYGFVCVTDVRCNVATRRMMEALGARVHV